MKSPTPAVVQPLYYRTLYPDSCLTVAILNGSLRSCLLLGCEPVWGLEAVNMMRTVIQLGSLSFQNTFWEVEKYTCVTTQCQCGVSEWPRDAGAIYNKGIFTFYLIAAMPGTTTWGPHPNVWDLISQPHGRISVWSAVWCVSCFCSIVILPGEELLQFFVRRSAVGTDETIQTSVSQLC